VANEAFFLKSASPSCAAAGHQSQKLMTVKLPSPFLNIPPDIRMAFDLVYYFYYFYYIR